MSNREIHITPHDDEQEQTAKTHTIPLYRSEGPDQYSEKTQSTTGRRERRRQREEANTKEREKRKATEHTHTHTQPPKESWAGRLESLH